jgi:hypothetical protein
MDYVLYLLERATARVVQEQASGGIRFVTLMSSSAREEKFVFSSTQVQGIVY